MLTIFTENITSRLSYVIEVIFEDILECPVEIISDRKLIAEKSHLLNYSNIEIEDIPFIRPVSILFEHGIRAQNLSMDSDGIIFNVESDIVAQDVFAATFYLISRYEEYVIQERDRFGRFPASASLLRKSGLLEVPLVDAWSLELYGKLRKLYPSLPEVKRSFSVLPTFDIDIAYAYSGRSWLRRFRASMKDLFTLRWGRMNERLKVKWGKISDSYDTYEYQKKVCQERESRHFFLLGNYGKLDKNLSHRSRKLRSLINEVSIWSEVGIHPSMASNNFDRRLKKEIKRLQKILKNKITESRQHYLQVSLPETYQRLIAQGIEMDHSLGFADLIGFRAGTCSVFRWYDLIEEESTPLYLLPIAVMDSTLKDYMQLNPEEAIERITELKKNVKTVSGKFVSLWHNHSIADYKEWKGWRAVFESCL